MLEQLLACDPPDQLKVRQNQRKAVSRECRVFRLELANLFIVVSMILIQIDGLVKAHDLCEVAHKALHRDFLLHFLHLHDEFVR